MTLSSGEVGGSDRVQAGTTRDVSSEMLLQHPSHKITAAKVWSKLQKAPMMAPDKGAKLSLARSIAFPAIQ